jgi:cyclic pyranopterin phosphate synthase
MPASRRPRSKSTKAAPRAASGKVARGAGTAAKARPSHLDEHGRARMVDVGAKPVTAREATARGQISMSREALNMVLGGTAKKGDVLGVARIAAIQAAKRTSDLIPLCHALPLTRVAVAFTFDDDAPAVAIEVVAETLARTGVEMEALSGAAVGLLTIYDMVKAVDRGMRIEGVRLLEKRGGRSGRFLAE